MLKYSTSRNHQLCHVATVTYLNLSSEVKAGTDVIAGKTV